MHIKVHINKNVFDVLSPVPIDKTFLYHISFLGNKAKDLTGKVCYM